MDITQEMRALLEECIRLQYTLTAKREALQKLIDPKDEYPPTQVIDVILDVAMDMDSPDDPLSSDRLDQWMRTMIERMIYPPDGEDMTDDEYAAEWLIIHRKSGLFWSKRDGYVARSSATWFIEPEIESLDLPESGRWIHVGQLPDYNRRCLTCGDIVLAGEMRDHLAEHSEAKNLQNPYTVESAFTEIGWCEACGHLLESGGGCPVCN